MSALPQPTQPLRAIDQRHLDALEEEAMYILREVVASFERPALLYSAGKDSCVVLHLARKAFCRRRAGGGFEGALPLPLLHVDTGHNFPEVLEFRDREVARHGDRLLVAHLEESIRRGSVRLQHPLESRNTHQSVALLEAVEQHALDCLVGGARRDEDKARAKERIFSHRDAFGQWLPKEQRAELWALFNTRLRPGEHFRSFPISNWTELDVWLYIAREGIALPSLYYSHVREVVARDGLLVPLTALTPPRASETVQRLHVRFRTVGDMSCTCPVPSHAADAPAVVAETLRATHSERGATRLDDRGSRAAMEQRKLQGYF